MTKLLGNLISKEGILRADRRLVSTIYLPRYLLSTATERQGGMSSLAQYECLQGLKYRTAVPSLPIMRC